MPILPQILIVPDVAGPPAPYYPSLTWTAATLSKLTRLGFGVNTNQADIAVLLGSATGTDPITPDNQNQLGTFYGGAGSQTPDVQNIRACAFYAFIRYPPPAGTQDPPAILPTVSAPFEMQGT
jgi:hypothetical protein